MQRGLTRQLQRVENAFWEWRLGIATRGYASTESEERIHYGTVSYPAIFKILSSLRLKSSDVIVDLGCGKGRVVCCAARLPIREVVGVEYSEELCSVARENGRRLRGRRAPIAIIRCPAEEFEYASGDVFYLFHPFGAKTLNEVLGRLHRRSQSTPEGIRVVYVNPIHESCLRDCGWLKEYDRWRPGHVWGLEHDVSFWRGSR